MVLFERERKRERDREREGVCVRAYVCESVLVRVCGVVCGVQLVLSHVF